ncbi:MAG: type II toxin-antitoxin system HicB family antitoxin [Ruminococcus sp.]|nr:type II toxin-antitoxin system HicB family antitoxin [Ruminococcus sp.]
MPKYVYPAIFTEESKGYSVNFPDIECCYTSGDSLIEAMEMAEDVLALMLCCKEKDGEKIPTASSIKDIKTNSNSFVTLILCDTTDYQLVECKPDEE